MKIFYINLDRSHDRRAKMEQLLGAHGLQEMAQRRPGIVAEKPLNKMTISETGCLLSHLSILTSLADDETALILEDDVCFVPDFGKRIAPLLKRFSNTDQDFLFLGQTVMFNDVIMHSHLLKALQTAKTSGQQLFINASNSYKFGSFAYAVRGKSVRKIKDLIGAIDLEAAACPIDQLQKNWLASATLKGAIVLPYMVGVNAALDTTIKDRARATEHRLHAQAVNLYLEGHSPNSSTAWRELLDGEPNEHALALCKAIYDRLIQ